VLLVDDILTNDGALIATLAPIEASGAHLVLAAALIDGSGGASSVTSPVGGVVYAATALSTVALPTFEPGPRTCPGCAAGTTIKAPGSTGTKVRAPGGLSVDPGRVVVAGADMPSAPRPDAADAAPYSLGPTT
jgi:hypothetical protein